MKSIRKEFLLSKDREKTGFPPVDIDEILANAKLEILKEAEQYISMQIDYVEKLNADRFLLRLDIFDGVIVEMR